LGFSVGSLTDELADRLGFKALEGVVVTSVESGSLAEEKGITVGMLIMEVDREPVKNTKEFDEAIEKAGKEGSVLLLINDGTHTRFIVLKLPNK
jgi:serine protease Do